MVTKEAQIQKTILINGMHCASCVSGVEKGRNNREGIQEASVNVATESAMITYDPQRISETEIHEAVEQAGSTVAEEHPKKRTRKIGGMHCVIGVNSVQQSVQQIDDVQEVTVNLATETAPGSCRNARTTEDFEEAVGNAGYEIREVDTESGRTKAEAKQQREQQK